MNPPSPPGPAPALPTSLGARLLNVFVTPGEVFDEVKAAPPNHWNWLVPSLLGAVFGLVFTFVIFSQETILHAMREAQERPIQQKVESGKMTQAQADQALQMMEKFSSPAFLKTVGAVGAVVASFAWPFLIGLVVWLLGAKLFKGEFDYLQAVEVCGLAGVVSLVGGLVNLLIVVSQGNLLANAGPILLVHEIDGTNKLHLVLSAFDLMFLWYLGVVSLGMARLSGASVAKCAAWIFGLWLLLKAAGLGLTFLQLGR